MRAHTQGNDLYLILELAEEGDLGMMLERRRRTGPLAESEIWHGGARTHAHALAVG